MPSPLTLSRRSSAGLPRGGLTFGPDCPWYIPLPASPTIAANSAAIVTKINSWAGPASITAGAYNTVDEYDIPIYWASPTDPLFTLSITADSRGVQLNGTQIRIPDAAKPAGGTDHHLVVVDETRQWVTDFWAVSSKPAGGGTLVATAGGRTRLHGLGFDNANSIASKTAAGLGLIDPDEARNGTINHAIAILTKSTDGTNIWPASGNAAAADPTNAPPCGTWLQLNMTSAAIDALGQPVWKTAILKAMATYGAVVIDTGGSSWNCRFIGDGSHAAVGGRQRVKDYATAQGDPGQWYLDTGSGYYYGDLKTGVPWTNFRVIDSTYLKGLHDARIAPLKLDPVSTITNNWTLTTGATAHACLTEATYAPFTADSTSRISTGTVGRVCEVKLAAFTAPTGRAPVGVTGWFWGNTGTGTTYLCELVSGTTVLASYTKPANTGQGWHAVSAPSLVGVDLTDLRLRFTLTAGTSTSNIYAAHAFVDVVQA